MRISDQEFNRLNVLRHLRAAEPASRTELAELSGLTGGSITAIVGDLVKRGLVVEEKAESAGLGRPRVNLRINPDGAYAAAASMTMVGGLRVSVVNLRGETVWSQDRPATHDGKLETLARTVANELAGAIASSGVPPHKIVRAGIALPALVDNRSGEVLTFQTFAPGPYPFAKAVEDIIGIPTSVDNDMNLLAKAMQWFGGGAQFDDFTLIVLDLGIGSARYQNNELVCGSHGIGAEIGHVRIVPEGGAPCYCGSTGCLQAYASISGIVQYQGLERIDPISTIATLRKEFAALLDRAEGGSAEDRARIERAGRYLGIAIANHVNMQDPDLVVVLTLDPRFGTMIAPPCLAAIAEGTLPALKGRAMIRFDSLSPDLLAQGAAALVLEKLYQSR